MANIAGKRLLSGTAISPAARNRTRLLAIPGRLSQCLRRAVRFWLTAAPARVGAAGRRYESRTLGGIRARRSFRGLLFSVPFTRGTPPWRRRLVGGAHHALCFSPLHEGDTSVAFPPS